MKMRERHLYWNDFEHAVVKHLSRKGKANEKPKPLVQRDVVFPPAVENRPDAGREDGNEQQAACQYPAEHIVMAAAAVAESQSCPDMQDVDGSPKNELAQGPERG